MGTKLVFRGDEPAGPWNMYCLLTKPGVSVASAPRTA